MDHRVYIVRCPTYEEVGEKIIELLDMMGGIVSLVKPGQRVVLKVNLLRAAWPEEAVTTHPAVVSAVAQVLKARGAMPIIADSPGSGYPYDARVLGRLYRMAGLDEAAEASAAELNFDTSHGVVSFPEGRLIKRFEVITPVLESDVVFNLCKLKTHLLTGMTGAVKNVFGVIPGYTKPGYHAKLHDTDHFVDMLLDLVTCIQPPLSIMDAVIGMEGDGPSGGVSRRVGWLVAARNPLALDVVAGEIMGLEREKNPVLMAAERRGLSPHRLDHVRVVGAALDDLRVADFEIPATFLQGAGFARLNWLMPFFRRAASLQPRVVAERCIACGACREACPVGAIEISNGRARIDHGDCIRCYCCHEMCPQDAIRLRRGLLYRFLNRQ